MNQINTTEQLGIGNKTTLLKMLERDTQKLN